MATDWTTNRSQSCDESALELLEKNLVKSSSFIHFNHKLNLKKMKAEKYEELMFFYQ